jgi:flagellar basal-body rod protein FlgG
MLNSLRIAEIGLQAQKAQLDAVAQNLTNASTPAYKRVAVDFSTLLAPARAVAAPENGTAAPSQPIPYHIDLTSGPIQQTGDPLDIAISGNGFIEVAGTDGKNFLWRGGHLQVTTDGLLATSDGNVLAGDVRVPSGVSSLQIAKDGTVTGVLPGDASAVTLGHIELVATTNSNALHYLGGGLFDLPTDARQVLRGQPGQNGLGTLSSGYLEQANVQLIDETVNMMLAQRVYELNAKIVQASDEVMGLTNSLRK